ncbi:MAG: hypothetical protein COB02_05495 [Candidatus Cloacimonadota bacterium]|nr:MAG: hypothetical protein COB02_05495 [Candidatus Cloacimonadota bacterium]
MKSFLKSKKSIIYFFLFVSCAFCLDSHPNLSKTRQRIKSGINRIGKMNLSSIMEWAKKDFLKKRYQESLQKLRYHMVEDPLDASPWFLQGLIFERLYKYKKAYLSFEKSYELKKSRRTSNKMKSMFSKFPKKSKKIKIEPVAIKKAKKNIEEKIVLVEVNTYAKRSYKAFKSLETLQSQAKAYQVKKGSFTGFSLKSLKSMKLSTLNVNFQGLGEISMKGNNVYSSIYKDTSFQKEALKPYLSALSLTKEKKYKEASEILEKLSDYSKEEFLYLINIYRKQNSIYKELNFRLKIANKSIIDLSNYYWLAEYYYKAGVHERAIKYYNLLVVSQNAYKSMAQYRLKLMKNGGNYQLEEYMKNRRKNKNSGKKVK